MQSVALVGRDVDLPPDADVQLARALASECGPFVRGSDLRPLAGTRQIRMRAAAADFRDPGPRAISLCSATPSRMFAARHPARAKAGGDI